MAKVVAKRIAEAESEAKKKAQEITLMAVQRYAAEHTAESTVRTVAIPSDDMKGRIIGREGRNIRAIEKAHRNYPIGAYSASGTNSNTYAGTVAGSCCQGGMPTGLGIHPGSEMAPPLATPPRPAS
jgi:predicted RNA-binding protein YlqC (UPF0109 family)